MTQVRIWKLDQSVSLAQTPCLRTFALGDQQQADGVSRLWFDRYGCNAAIVQTKNNIYDVARLMEEAVALVSELEYSLTVPKTKRVLQFI